MLRALDEHGGVGVYTRYLTEELLSIDRGNEYVLFYRSAAQLGRFASHDNVTEVLVRAPGKALWDQVAIPWHCWRQRVDVVFHPKFTVPFLAPCRAMMVLHGAGWFLTDFFGAWDVRYIRGGVRRCPAPARSPRTNARRTPPGPCTRPSRAP
jgi:hypothetical protein